MDHISAETARLLEQVRAGDQAALNEILARHRPRLRRMVELRLARRDALGDRSSVARNATRFAALRIRGDLLPT
jgi:hypothetical protein